jgi:hypothetical protein
VCLVTLPYSININLQFFFIRLFLQKSSISQTLVMRAWIRSLTSRWRSPQISAAKISPPKIPPPSVAAAVEKLQPLVRFPATVIPHSHPFGNTKFWAPRVRFRHPAYPDIDHTLGRSNIIFELPRLDNGGVHYGTAVSICFIISGNRPGYLSTDASGKSWKGTHYDEILNGNDYYFHLADQPEFNTRNQPYPICRSFNNWSFPHKNIPHEWLMAFV